MALWAEASGHDSLARFGATHPAPRPDHTRGERCVRGHRDRKDDGLFSPSPTGNLTRNESRPGAAAWSRGPNQEEPIRDSALVETTVGGLMGRGMLARPGARLGPRRCGRARVQVAGTRNGLASAPDADDRHGRHPPAQRKAASCRPRHRVTAHRVRGARGSVRGEGSVSQAWSCQSVQSLPSPYPVARIRNQPLLIKHVFQLSYTISGTISGTILYPICTV